MTLLRYRDSVNAVLNLIVGVTSESHPNASVGAPGQASLDWSLRGRSAWEKRNPPERWGTGPN